MTESIRIIKNGYILIGERFDEDVDIDSGASYHGYSIMVKRNGTDREYCVRIYDDEDYIYFLNEDLEKEFIIDVVYIMKEKFDIKGYKILGQEIVYLN